MPVDRVERADRIAGDHQPGREPAQPLTLEPALVSAAVLSNRYVSDRFLPDKAIDLVDEACAMIRTEIDSMPAELDEIRRRIMQLEIEREALRKETDAASKERLGKLEKELANLKADSDELTARWQEWMRLRHRLPRPKPGLTPCRQTWCERRPSACGKNRC